MEISGARREKSTCLTHKTTIKRGRKRIYKERTVATLSCTLSFLRNGFPLRERGERPDTAGNQCKDLKIVGRFKTTRKLKTIRQLVENEKRC